MGVNLRIKLNFLWEMFIGRLSTQYGIAVTNGDREQMGSVIAKGPNNHPVHREHTGSHNGSKITFSYTIILFQKSNLF